MQEAISANVYRLIGKQHGAQADFARSMKHSTVSVSGKLNGVKGYGWTLKDIVKISNLYDVTIDSLLSVNQN